MKLHHLMLWAASALLCACQSAVKETQVKGKLEGLPTDTLLVDYSPVNDLQGRTGVKDTLVAQGGAFAYTVEQDDLPVRLLLYPKPGASTLYRTVEVLAFPGETLTVSGSMTDYKVEGNKFYQVYASMQEMRRPYEEKVHALTDVVMELQGTEKWTPQTSDSLRNLYREAMDGLMKFQGEYIRNHPDEDVSVYLLRSMGKQYAADLLPLLGEKARNGVLAPLYEAMTDALATERKREAAESRITEGAEAPDFQLKDIEGKDFRLSSLRGKFVVLDFWGSWCGWCIKGFPEMKKAYAKYRDRMEIVGIDCGDTEEKWKAAVAEQELPWTHVRNMEEKDLTVAYGVKGFPTKIILDGEGKVLRVVVGENPDFYAYLDSLFK